MGEMISNALAIHLVLQEFIRAVRLIADLLVYKKY